MVNLSVTVTDVNGCESTANANMVEPDVLDVLVVITQQPSCFGVCDGSLQGQVTGGGTIYLFVEIHFQSSVNATGLCGDGTNILSDCCRC